MEIVKKKDKKEELIIPRHGYHLVNASPWPLYISVGLLLLTSGTVLNFFCYNHGPRMVFRGLLIIFLCSFAWWRDVTYEGTYEGCHTSYVQKGLRYGMLLFILSDVMFFSGFFWAFFHSSLAPAIEIGSVWPPRDLVVLNPWKVPLLNTVLLVMSGASITWAHYALLNNNKIEVFYGFFFTILMALLFTLLQVLEYLEATFRISDSVYGSVFFIATGFHGFHVIVGTIFIVVCAFRYFNNHFTKEHHFGFEAAAWYWHFVDVVWLFLFISIYYWGNGQGISGYVPYIIEYTL